MTGAALAKLAQHSRSDGDCIVWTRHCQRSGHGVVRWASKLWKVHRLAWVERHGPIPPETPHVLHTCDNPPCWRDEHLYLGTNADNVRDRTRRHRHWADKRTHCSSGHELTPENLVVRRDGFKRCRSCHREGSLRRFHASKTALDRG